MLVIFFQFSIVFLTDCVSMNNINNVMHWNGNFNSGPGYSGFGVSLPCLLLFCSHGNETFHIRTAHITIFVDFCFWNKYAFNAFKKNQLMISNIQNEIIWANEKTEEGTQFLYNNRFCQFRNVSPMKQLWNKCFSYSVAFCKSKTFVLLNGSTVSMVKSACIL